MRLTGSAMLVAQACHRVGTRMPAAWHSCANVMALGFGRYVLRKIQAGCVKEVEGELNNSLPSSGRMLRILCKFVS